MNRLIARWAGVLLLNAALALPVPARADWREAGAEARSSRFPGMRALKAGELARDFGVEVNWRNYTLQELLDRYEEERARRARGRATNLPLISEDGRFLRLPAGTPVWLRPAPDSGPPPVRQGAIRVFEVAREVRAVNGQVLIARGAEAYGTLTRHAPAGRPHRKGSRWVSMDHARSTDGRLVPLRGFLDLAPESPVTAPAPPGHPAFHPREDPAAREERTFVVYVDADVVFRTNR